MGKLEREVESYWTAHYFLQQQRANPRAAYEAMFLCWFKQDVGESLRPRWQSGRDVGAVCEGVGCCARLVFTRPPSVRVLS